jgi:hypothetical protein
MRNRFRRSSIDASYQVSVHWAKRFQRRSFFIEINQSETRIACGGHVSQWIGTKCLFFLEDDIPLMLQFIWPSSFKGEDFKKLANQKQESPVAAMFLTDRDEMSILYRGPSTYASYQVSVHLAERFQRRRLKCERLTDDRRRTPSDGKSSHCLWQSELKMYISNLVLTPSPCMLKIKR